MSFFASEDFFFNFNEKNRGAKLINYNVLEAALAVFLPTLVGKYDRLVTDFLKRIIAYKHIKVCKF